MQVKVSTTGPMGCGKSWVIDEIEEMLVNAFGRCAVQSKNYTDDDHTVTFVIYKDATYDTNNTQGT